MTPDIVVDVGNSRIKWGWMPASGTDLQAVSIPPDSAVVYEEYAGRLPFASPLQWVIASVHPARLESFTDWAHNRGDHVAIIQHEHISMPMPNDVQYPLRTGIDRLLNALAAIRIAKNRPLGVIDVGTAVTADIVSRDGTFQGGMILPGPATMFESLYKSTAKLPRVGGNEIPSFDGIGANTGSSIRSGVAAAQIGAVRMFVEFAANAYGKDLWLILTGGGLGALAKEPFTEHFKIDRVIVKPTLTLEGIRIAAEALP